MDNDLDTIDKVRERRPVKFDDTDELEALMGQDSCQIQ